LSLEEGYLFTIKDHGESQGRGPNMLEVESEAETAKLDGMRAACSEESSLALHGRLRADPAKAGIGDSRRAKSVKGRKVEAEMSRRCPKLEQ
jgi:hypothetical protein